MLLTRITKNHGGDGGADGGNHGDGGCHYHPDKLNGVDCKVLELGLGDEHCQHCLVNAADKRTG